MENPFVRKNWVQQAYGLTNNRPDCLEKLFSLPVEAIKQAKPINENTYPAFVGIRWGFARIGEGILVMTEKGRWFVFTGGHDLVERVLVSGQYGASQVFKDFGFPMSARSLLLGGGVSARCGHETDAGGV